MRQRARNDNRLEAGFQLQGTGVDGVVEKCYLCQLGKDIDHRCRTRRNGAPSGNYAVASGADQDRRCPLAPLKTLQNLEYLNLYGTAVTGAGLTHLAGLSSLKNLYLWQAKVTPEGSRKRKESLPKLDGNLGWDSANPAKQ